MKTFLRVCSSILSIILILAIAFGAGYRVCLSNQEPGGEIVEPEVEAFDLQLPGESELQIVTVEEVTVKLDQIGELATCEGKYHVSYSKDFTRTALDDYEVPFTTNTISIDCEGIVKVGYDMSRIDVRVVSGSETEDGKGKIFISIPEARITDNYIIWDSVECVEKNNILHPIEFAQYKSMIAAIEELGLQEAVDNGIFEAADEHLKTVITAFLAEFKDYEITFMES